MGELLRLIFVFVVIWLLLRLLTRPASTNRTPHQSPSNRPSGGVTMLPCARCGVYIPKNEAIESEGRVYCSREHAAQGPESR